MIAPATDIRELLDKAVTALVCALAHDEAQRSGADAETLAELRGYWTPDAEEVVDEAERAGLWGDYDPDRDDLLEGETP